MRSLAPVALFAVAVAVLAGCSTSAGPPAGTKSSPTNAGAPPAPAGRLVFREYLNSDQDRAALFSVKSDGTGVRQLTKPGGQEVDADASWSPDGSQIVFTRYIAINTEAEAHQIVVMNADGTGQKALTPGHPAGATIAGFDDSPAFSPDGKQIAYIHGNGEIEDIGGREQLEHSNIWLMHADGTNQHAITEGKAYSADLGGLAWSADGKQLAFGVWNSQDSDPAGGRAMFVMNLDGTGRHQLTPWPIGADGFPDWSATANEIVFRAAPDEESGIGNFYLVRPDGTHLTQITHYNNEVASHRVTFSPDGKWIAYGVSPNDATIHIYESRIDGSGARAITKTKLASSSPDWTG